MSVKRKSSSDIWIHFTKKTGDFNLATCKYCASDISRGGKNAVYKGFTTSNLWAHVVILFTSLPLLLSVLFRKNNRNRNRTIIVLIIVIVIVIAKVVIVSSLV